LPKNEIIELAKIISFFSKTEKPLLISLTFYTIGAFLSLEEGDFKAFTALTKVFN
jgi:hypothetical protein